MLYDEAAERALIGTVLRLESVPTGQDWEEAWTLEPEDFFLEAHQFIWDAILTLRSSGVRPEEITICEYLQKKDRLRAIGGPACLMELDQEAHVLPNLGEWTYIIRDRSFRRQAIHKADELRRALGDIDQDPQGLIAQAGASLAILSEAGVTDLKTAEFGLDQLRMRIEAVQKGESRGFIKTGIRVWDHYMKGLAPSKLTLIGSQPSVGKTALKNRIVFNIAARGQMVGVFELEDPVEDFVKREIARLSGIHVRRIGSEQLNSFEYQRLQNALAKARGIMANILAEEGSRMSASKVAARARQMIAKGCVAIGIDNASEVHNDTNLGRHDLDTGASVRVQRDVAKDTRTPVFELVHFHRPKGEQGKEPRSIRPTSGMWRNSGGYEEAARVAVGLWVDETRPGFVTATVLKQTEGDKDFDFWMGLDPVAGLIENDVGSGPDDYKGAQE